ncbi:hypothetical protein [Aromatoleum diolicum]|uniref:DUF7931 domain-containing protein n=1 Tax=Aromatoleum diolicum TaxID=75796 RepID=A0ABX1QGT7_9RHOO|nr:hypothetical protein [Aromatoleum diolicum]NMG76730.1 hypothetical protein [Aromatoleum diolicum]
MGTFSERYLDSYGEFRDAVLEALGLAHQTVSIFDPDLREWGLESVAGTNLLEALCSQSPRPDTLRILVHTTTFLEQECPRLIGVLRRFGHCASVRTTDPGARAWTQPFLVADRHYLVTRFHQELPRGKVCFATSSTNAYVITQFETMWLRGEHHASGAPLSI